MRKMIALGLILLVLLMAVVALAGCGTATKYSEGGASAPATSGIEILTHSGGYHPAYVGDTNPVYHVGGTAKNITDKQLTYAEIRVKFYDGDGNLLDSGLDNIIDLGAGEVWNFDVAEWHSGITRYEIGVGTTT